MNHLRRLSPLALVLAAAPLLAQSSTTAALQGQVLDPSGQPLGGARVRIASEVLIGGERTATTGANGLFRFPLLPPGVYRISVEASGFAPHRVTERLSLGQTTTANLRVAKAAEAVVEVVGAASTQEGVATGVTTALSAQALEAIPVGRDLTQVAGLTPGVTVSDSTSGASVRAWGGDGMANAYTIDGLNVGDAKSGEKWVYANPDWFSEMQVGGLGAPAEYGGFMGAYINGVVKSGGNEVQGTFTTYFQPNRWAARRDNDRLAADERELYDGRYLSVSLGVGGPILKDRLWYFVSAETNRDDATDSPIGVDFPVKLDNPRFLGKLTWQVNPSATWDLFLEYDEVNRENRYATRYYTREATQKQESPSTLFTTSYKQVIGQSVLNLRFSALNARDDRSSYNPNGYTLEMTSGYTDPDDDTQRINYLHPTVLTALGTVGSASPELIGKSYWGNVRRSNLLRENQRSRQTLSATYDLFLSGVFSADDAHALRMGVEFESSQSEERRWIASPNGVAYRTRVRTGGLRPYRAYTGGGREVDTDMQRAMVFLQDTWTLNARFQLRPGVRVETFKGGAQDGPTLWGTTTVAPRLGFTWNVTADQGHVLKAHVGRYFAGFSSDLFQRAIPGAHENTNVFVWGSSADLVNPYRPDLIPVDTTVFGPAYDYAYNFNLATLDRNHKQPYTDELMLSYDWRLSRAWLLGLTAVRRTQKDILVQNDPSWADPAYTVDTVPVTSPITGLTYTTYVSDEGLGDPNNGHRFLLTNDPAAKNTYEMLTLSLDRPMLDRWSLTASVTWAKSEGNYSASAGTALDNFNDPNAQINAYGRLPYVNDREVRLRGAYEFPWTWRTRISASFTHLSGERYTPLIDMTSVFELNQNALSIFAAPRGSARYPSRDLLDVKITQDLNFSKRVRAELFLDVFNLLNEGAAYTWDETIAYEDGAPLDTYRTPIYTEDPRRVRVGFKLRF